jgi:hypothetical protein
VEKFFAAEGADIGDMDARRRVIVESKYRLIGDFPPVSG